MDLKNRGVIMKLPIIDPLGILKKPAEDALKLVGVDVELADPIRELALDFIDGMYEGIESERQDEVVNPPTPPSSDVPHTGSEREAYLEFGKRAITFDCTRCQAIAEQVAAEYAPNSPKKLPAYTRIVDELTHEDKHGNGNKFIMSGLGIRH